MWMFLWRVLILKVTWQAPGERLTLLGRHLAALPLPPRIGKMLLYGVLFSTLDPILTVSCCMAYRCRPGHCSVLKRASPKKKHTYCTN